MKTSRRSFLGASLGATAALSLGCGSGGAAAGSGNTSRGGTGVGSGSGSGGGSAGGHGNGGLGGSYGGGPGLGYAGEPSGGAPLRDGGGPWRSGDGGVVACRETAPDIEGPFFTPDSPERGNLVDPSVTGTLLVVRGRILDGGCNPVEGAILDVWQADDTGAYDTVGMRLRGHQRTDATGSYSIETIVPGRYLNGAQYRPAHIHAKVAVPGREILTTQLYFEGDPFNEVDPWFNAETMLRPGAVDGVEIANFDFVVV